AWRRLAAAAADRAVNPDSPQWPVRQRALEDGKVVYMAVPSLAVAAAAGLIGSHTLLVTTVHELQVRPGGEIPVADHDIRLDMIVTPERVILAPRRGRPKSKLRWDQLTEEK